MIQGILPEENPEIRSTQRALQNAEFGLWGFFKRRLCSARTSLARLPDPEPGCFRYHFHSEKLRDVPAGCWKSPSPFRASLHRPLGTVHWEWFIFYYSPFDPMPTANIKHKEITKFVTKPKSTANPCKTFASAFISTLFL